MTAESLSLTENQKNGLTVLLEETKANKPKELHSIYDEIIETLKRGRVLGNDAYQARYLRDAIALNEKAKEDFADIAEYIEKTFF